MSIQNYPKWVGVIFGLLISGSAHFLAGDKNGGVKWYFGICLAIGGGYWILAVPGFVSLLVGGALCIAGLLLWLIMLKQSYRNVRRIGIWGWIGLVALSFLLHTGWDYLHSTAVAMFKMPTSGMTPTIIPGDYLLSERVSHHFGGVERGDIIVFSTHGVRRPNLPAEKFHMKRVAGLPGETVEINPPNLVVNGNFVNNPPIFDELSFPSKKTAFFTSEDKIVLRENEYFVVGDNMENSLDSRYYGPIKAEDIYGTVSRICWPLSRIGQLNKHP